MRKRLIWLLSGTAVGAILAYGISSWIQSASQDAVSIYQPIDTSLAGISISISVILPMILISAGYLIARRFTD